LDLEESVDAQMLEKIGEYNKETRNNSGNIIGRLKIALEDNMEYWVDAGDEIVKYTSMFVLVLLAITLFASTKRRQLSIIFPVTVAGLLLESLYFVYTGRIVVRIADALLLPLCVIGCLSVVEVLCERRKKKGEKGEQRIAKLLISGAICFIIFSILMSLNVAINEKHYSITVRQNNRIESLKNYTKGHPDSFYFYDSQDFISCTEYAFKTYKKGEILNHDSLGSWNVCSPSYYERNEKFGFSSSIEGLLSSENNVYFVATSEPKIAIKKLLAEKYNKQLMLADTISSDNYNIYIYMVVDND